ESSNMRVRLTDRAKLHTNQNWLHALRRRDNGKTRNEHRISAAAWRLAMLRFELANADLVSFLSPKALDDELGMPKQTRSDAERELKRYGWLTHVGLTGNGYDKFLLTLGW